MLHDDRPHGRVWHACCNTLSSCAGRAAQVSKALACGDVGLGAMAAPQTIDSAARGALAG
jgi:hypothetical protein